MTDEELEKIKTKKDKTIHIIQFAKMSEVNMQMLSKFLELRDVYRNVRGLKP